MGGTIQEVKCDCQYNNWDGTTHVYGKGPTKSPRLAIIGEAPGAEEDQQGLPFAGGSGRILDVWLAKVGIQRSECYIDNVVQHRPPNNDIDHANLPEAYRSLYKRLAGIQPNLVLALGNTALRAFLPAASISDWRGSLFPSVVQDKQVKVLATLHPAFIMRQRRMWDVVLHDLQRAAEASHLPRYTELPHHTYYMDPPLKDLSNLLDKALAAPTVAIDIETDWNWVSIERIGVSHEHGVAITAPLTPDTAEVWGNFFLNVKSTVMHNGLFDAFQLRKIFPWVKMCDHDTMLYHHLLYQHLPHDLGFLCSVYTLYPYYKNMISVRPAWYNCRDVDVTLRCYTRLTQELQEANLI